MLLYGEWIAMKETKYQIAVTTLAIVGLVFIFFTWG